MSHPNLKFNVWHQVRDYVMIVLGLLFYALGFSAFVLPEKVVTGGVIGLASLFHFAFNWNVAVVNYAINILLLVIAYRTVGRQFVLRTIFGATVASVLLYFMVPLFPKPLVEQQPFMNIIIGATLCGLGLGMTFTHNGSSGGTDIIAAVVTKFRNVSFGRMMLYCDVVIISSSYLVFHSVDKIVYGLIFMIITAFVADLVINNNRQAVQFLIFSEKWEDIANAITSETHRGCTVLDGVGWYTKHHVKIVMVMCRKMQSMQIFRITKAVDPKAFISQWNVNGVYGEGFDEMKVRLKHKDAQAAIAEKENAPQESSEQ
jgi:uncharacterized membrane-anchored protein YitT (DUF2179 family)